MDTFLEWAQSGGGESTLSAERQEVGLMVPSGLSLSCQPYLSSINLAPCALC